MHRYRPTAEVSGAISIALFQYPFCLKDDSEQYHCLKLVIKGKCQNSIMQDADIARQIAGYESD